MFHVLIVDDESLMRTYLAKAIPALCPGFQICGMANDGLQAMELLEHQQFDLVLTDIRMPEMDGLSLSKYIFETAPETKVVIVSGYNDFEYAKTAIRYHVSDYLLKPLNDKELAGILRSIKEQKEKGRHKTPEFSSDTSLFSLRCMLAEALIDADTANIDLLLCELEQRVPSPGKSFGCAIAVSVDEADLFLLSNNIYEITTYSLKLNLCIKQYCSPKNIISYYDNRGLTYIVLEADDSNQLYEAAGQLYEAICALAKANHMPKITFSCGTIFSDIMNLEYSCMQAVLNMALILKGQKSPVYSNLDSTSQEFLLNLNSCCQTIYSNFLSDSWEKLLLNLKQYCQNMSDSFTLSTMIRYFVHLLKYIYSRSNIKSQYIKSAYHSLTQSFNDMIPDSGLSMEKACYAIYRAICALQDTSMPSVLSEPNQIVHLARQYILLHYSEPVSLTQIADEIGVNNCYLSDLFHKNLGESYSKYLLRIRMEQAVQLLKNRPDIKIYDIAMQVGYVSPKHFISVFKKYYGVTPSNYPKNPT